jgi:hypothetical protein
MAHLPVLGRKTVSMLVRPALAFAFLATAAPARAAADPAPAAWS